MRSSHWICLMVIALAVSGCQPPSALLINSRDESVTLALENVEVEPKEFPPGEGRPVYGTDGLPIQGRGVCVGEGFVVTDTESGVALGSSDEPVCGATVIRVAEDGTVSTG